MASSSGAPRSAALEAQHAAARSLIEQLVANSDRAGDDAKEFARQHPELAEQQQQQPQQQQSPAADGSQQPDGSAAVGGARYPPMQSQNKGSAVPAAVMEAAAARQAALQRRQEEQYPAGSGLSATDELLYQDEVVAAFESYGQITDAILSEWKEMFALFDHDNTGFILTDDLGTVLRGLGRNLTEERVATLINAYDQTGSGRIDFQTFYTMMCENAPMPGPCYEAQVLRDFHVFDTYRDGLIPVVSLVHLLRNLGEPLTRDDVDHLLQEIYIDGDNKVNIKDFVQHMFRTSAPNPE